VATKPLLPASPQDTTHLLETEHSSDLSDLKYLPLFTGAGLTFRLVNVIIFSGAGPARILAAGYVVLRCSKPVLSQYSTATNVVILSLMLTLVR